MFIKTMYRAFTVYSQVQRTKFSKSQDRRNLKLKLNTNPTSSVIKPRRKTHNKQINKRKLILPCHRICPNIKWLRRHIVFKVKASVVSVASLSRKCCRVTTLLKMAGYVRLKPTERWKKRAFFTLVASRGFTTAVIMKMMMNKSSLSFSVPLTSCMLNLMMIG